MRILSQLHSLRQVGTVMILLDLDRLGLDVLYEVEGG
jgi:hypothetical protein